MKNLCDENSSPKQSNRIIDTKLTQSHMSPQRGIKDFGT